MGCKGLLSTTALPDAEIPSHCSILSTVSSSIWLLFRMLSIIWSSDRHPHPWQIGWTRWSLSLLPDHSVTIFSISSYKCWQFTPIPLISRHATFSCTRSASRGRREPNFTVKKKRVKKPRFKDTHLNYMHTHRTSVGTPVFFPHFPYLKGNQENLPVGLSLGSSPSGRGKCLALTFAVCLQGGRCFHSLSHIENQSGSLLPAKSLSRIENWVLQKYLHPFSPFILYILSSYLPILTPLDVLT